MDRVLTLAAREARLAALTTTQAVWMAMACAERLATNEEPGRRSELRDALDVAWDAARTGEGAVAGALAGRLEARDDADDDPVAATVYALEASAGSREAARWAANRCLDAAFEAVPYPEGSYEFRPLDEDAASDVVQGELRWQLLAADFVCAAADVDEVRAWTRPASGPAAPAPA